MDEGTEALKLDIHVLLSDVIDGNFHDFNSEKYATPKMALVTRLNEIIENTKQGKYDNTNTHRRG